MIRLLKRRLIIPRGDTGSFSIPTLGTVSEGDVAIFGIFDPLTHETVLLKSIYATPTSLTFTLKMEDTIDLEPKKYNWDISIYHLPEFDEDGELIGAAETNSYYAAYKLPICEIKEVALDMNKERRRTRDLLLDAENPVTPTNYVSSIRAVYPWENMQLSFFAGQLYAFALANGYEGSADDFNKQFTSMLAEKTVHYMSRDDFPIEGEENHLYFDTEGKILYYYDNEYLSVNATLIANTVVNGGGP